jgi:hypothetical protein
MDLVGSYNIKGLTIAGLPTNILEIRCLDSGDMFTLSGIEYWIRCSKTSLSLDS